MRVVRCVGWWALCLGLAGCASAGKKTANPPPATPAARGAERGPAVPTDRIGRQTPDPTAPPPGVDGLLAGRVIDNFNGRPQGPVYIQVVEPGSPAGGAPIEVAADSQGYFTIQGSILKPGHHYQLVARTRTGDQVLAGSTWATPPDPRVLIRISSDFAGPGTPALPPAPTWPAGGSSVAGGPAPAPVAPAPAPAPVADPRTAGSDPGWQPGRGAFVNTPTPSLPRPQVPDGAAGLGTPVGIPGAPTPTPVPQPAVPPSGVRAEQIAGGDGLARNAAPITSVPSPVGPGNGQPPIAFVAGPARVPSCDLTGQTLNNFALNDLSGRPWEYRHDHRGRLTLLDFWGTWCIPCQHAIPHLRILQERYGPYGLEVIGIAYEQGTPAERVAKVDRVRKRLGINYLLLMGDDRETCPVRQQFAVVNYPTLVLLDESGRIIWRAERAPDLPLLRELENVVRQQLRVR